MLSWACYHICPHDFTQMQSIFKKKKLNNIILRKIIKKYLKTHGRIVIACEQALHFKRTAKELASIFFHLPLSRDFS